MTAPTSSDKGKQLLSTPEFKMPNSNMFSPSFKEYLGKSFDDFGNALTNVCRDRFETSISKWETSQQKEIPKKTRVSSPRPNATALKTKQTGDKVKKQLSTLFRIGEEEEPESPKKY